LVLFFDSDEAGQAATLKGILTGRKNGLACSVVEAGAPASALANAEEEPSAGSKSPAGSKDPADILKNFSPEALRIQAGRFVSDFDYLLKRAALLYDVSKPEGKERILAFIFPYLDLLNSETSRTSCVEAAADYFALLPSSVARDYNRYASGLKPVYQKDHAEQKNQSTVHTNEELSLLTVIALDYVSENPEKLFVKFRAAFDINEMEDENSREIYIALEECYRYGEKSTHELLARIPSEELKTFLLERSVSGEFSVNPGKLAADGIRKIKEKRLEKRQEEIIINLRNVKKNLGACRDGICDDERNSKEKELLAEKMRIDNELNQLKQGRIA
jgi:DNA primase